MLKNTERDLKVKSQEKENLEQKLYENKTEYSKISSTLERLKEDIPKQVKTLKDIKKQHADLEKKINDNKKNSNSLISSEKLSFSSHIDNKFNLRTTIEAVNGINLEDIQRNIISSDILKHDKSSLGQSLITQISKKAGTVTLLSETDHLNDHQDNVTSLISQIRAGIIKSNTLIYLERKEDGINLGIPDIKILAYIIKHNETAKGRNHINIPESITLSPIYKDALLYKTARDYGIDVRGAEDKNLQNNKKDNQERETNMVENIKNTSNKGHDVIYIVGKDHINTMIEQLGLNLEVHIKENSAVFNRILQELGTK